MTTKPQLPAENLGITEEQKENLNKVLSFAKAHPDVPFNMGWFLFGFDNMSAERYCACVSDPVPETHPCGTSCCLAGMGLQAGIAPLNHETWVEYINRVYGINGRSDDFDFLFSSYHPNDLPAAIRRLEYFLTEGLPDCASADLATFEIPA